LADNIIGIVSGIEKNTPTEFYVNLFSEDGKSIRVRIGDVVRVSVFLQRPGSYLLWYRLRHP